MKRFKLALAVLTFMSSLAYASFTDIPADHWASESVNNLYNKGLLAPTVENQDNFNGDGVFSRYEIASMLYYTIENMSETLEQKASEADLVALKALVANFAPELEKMGADSDELIATVGKNSKSIAKLEKNLKKMKSSLNDLKITGDIAVEQRIGMKTNVPGMGDMDYVSNVSILSKVNKNVNARVKLRLEKGEDAGVDAIELRAKTKKLYINLFEDSSKKVLSFEDTMSLFNGIEVAPDSGLILTGNTSLAGNKAKYVGMLFKKASGDIYGLQYTQNLDLLSKYSAGGKILATYVEKVNSYQVEDASNPDNAKAFYAVEGLFDYSPMKNMNLSFSSEYSTRQSPGLDLSESENIDYILPIENNEAVYMYGSADYKSSFGKFVVSGGMYNSGTEWAIGGLGNYIKKVFSETDDIKLEENMQGTVAKVGYGYKSFGTEVITTEYGENFIDSDAMEKLEWKTKYSVIPGKVKVVLEVTNETPELTKSRKQTDLDGNIESKVDSKVTYEPRISLNLIPGMSNEFKVNYTIDDNSIDTENRNTADYKSLELYGDHTQMFGNKAFKAVIITTAKGLDVDPEYKESEEFKVQTGWNFEVKDIKLGNSENKLLIGGRYNSNDVKGTTGKDLVSDTRDYRLFIANETEIGQLTLLYGVKYQQMLTSDENNKDLEDTNSDDDLIYAVGLEYDFGDDVVMSFRYGDAKITVNDDKEKFIEDKTSFADGLQDEFRWDIEAKF